MIDPIRIAVIGAGHVGASFAFNLLLTGLAAEIVLIDADVRRAEGEAMDLAHAVPFSHPTRVWAGTFDDARDAAIVVFTAGAAQKPGQTRTELAQTNGEILRAMLPAFAKQANGAVLIMATNPVDVMTYLALQLTDWPPERVLGSGTTLDTARLRHHLGLHFGIDPHNVHAYVIGEHGDSELPVWSSATIAGIPLTDACRSLGIACESTSMASVRRIAYENTRDAAYQIIERKGSTSYGVATAIVRIVTAILRDERAILTVSGILDGLYGLTGVCLSLPTVVDAGGRKRVLELPLTSEELDLLRRSAERVAAGIREVRV